MGKRINYNYIKEQIESVKGYELLSKKYINAHAHIIIQCDKGHIYKATWNNFQQNQRCSVCAGNIKYNYKYIKQQMKKEGYKLLSKSYKNNKTKLKIQCNKKHEYKARWNDFQQGCRCSVCDNDKKTSKAEKEVFNVVKHLLPNESIIENDRTQIVNSLTGFNLELDIWIPKLNKAIEFNGKYWHSLKEAKIRDKEKIKQCEEKSIDLLVIQEQNWLDNKTNEINKIRNWI